jgi:hypothetical protein
MQYEFQSTLYRCADDLAGAIAYEWMTGSGLNNPQQVDYFVTGPNATTPAQQADECAYGWGLDDEWLEARDLSRDALVAAFADFFKTRPDRRAD